MLRMTHPELFLDMNVNINGNRSVIKEELDLVDESEHEDTEENIYMHQKVIDQNENMEESTYENGEIGMDFEDAEGIGTPLEIDSDNKDVMNINEHQQLTFGDENIEENLNKHHESTINHGLNTIIYQKPTTSNNYNKRNNCINKHIRSNVDRRSIEIIVDEENALRESMYSEEIDAIKETAICVLNRDSELMVVDENLLGTIEETTNSCTSGKQSIETLSTVQKSVNDFNGVEVVAVTDDMFESLFNNHQVNAPINSKAELQKTEINIDKYVIDHLTACQEKIILNVCNKIDKRLLKRFETICSKCKINFGSDKINADFCPRCNKVLLHKCLLCVKFWPKRLDIERHIRKNFVNHCLQEKLKLEGTVECFYCQTSFLTLKKLMDHDKICKQALPFECSVCHQKTNTRNLIVEHIRNEHFEMIKNTPIINKTQKITRIKKKQANYKSIPITEEVIKCIEISKKIFISNWCKTCEETFTILICPICKQLPIYVCSLCKYVANNEHQLECHLRTMMHIQNFKQCGIPLQILDGTSSVEIDKLVNCRKCERKFLSVQFLEKHMKDKLCCSDDIHDKYVQKSSGDITKKIEIIDVGDDE